MALPAAIALGLLAGLPAPLRAADRLHPGMWEFTMTSGKDSNTFQQCINAEKAKSVNGDAKSAREHAEKESAGRCQITDYKVAGDSVSFSMICGTRTLRSTVRYRGDTAEGELSSKNGTEPAVVQQVQSKRIGDCP